MKELLDIGGVIKKINKHKARKIYLQVPEGLKTGVLDMAKKLEERGLEVFISVDPCYGACDIHHQRASDMDCDLILHMGHTDYGVKSNLPVIYEEFTIDFDPVPLLKKSLGELKPYRKICLVTTVQFLPSLRHAKKFLEEHGKRVFIGSSSKGKPGQVLGCDFSAATPLDRTVDCFIFMGSGTFHPLGLSLEVNKPVLFLDFEGAQLIDLRQEKRRLENIRLMQVEKAKSCRNFGILVSTKPGQLRVRTAEKVKSKISGMGKNAWILVADEITPEKLIGLQIECLVNTACPRIREDSTMFKKPIIGPGDIDKIKV